VKQLGGVNVHTVRRSMAGKASEAIVITAEGFRSFEDPFCCHSYGCFQTR